MIKYDFKKVEEKWQNKWDVEKPYKAIDFHPTKPKYYVLYEFFNISGSLHMGHLKGTVPADALARYKRFNGYNVLFPIGGDSFGLPAENAAIKRGVNPFDFVRDGMANAMNQSKKLGLSFDYDRTIDTSSPNYFKWTQWIFMQLLNNDKAYKKNGVVNFCPNCKTVLSNEDSQGGRCDRCGGVVTQENRSVWYLKMKEYADKLLDNIEKIDMAENLKELQRNWIGKSEGVQIKFKLVNESEQEIGEIEVFTTCVETVYGITYLVVAPENEIVNKLQGNINNYQDVKDYQNQTKLRSDFDRMSDTKNKTGCKLGGVYAINPINNKKVPVYIADFVLASYGTGAVMAVPCHDQRDYEFAIQYDIPMIQVIEGDCTSCACEKKEYIAQNSKMINSEEFSGMPVIEAKKEIANKLIAMDVAKPIINYKIQDWPFNRQRYWGEPFPVVTCEKCGVVALDEKCLPLELPRTDDYLPNEKGDSPLSKIESWVSCTCPKCGGKARRETDTMPNWAGSSWYWLRYCDPHNNDKLADFDKLKYWGQVDCYTGGTEHITRHVLYAFFWQNFLYEIGAVPSRDPFKKKMGSGLILDNEGKKMSKSSANGVALMDVINEYGADVSRLHTHFLAGYEDNAAWTFDGVTGIQAFINKVWSLQDIIKGDEISDKHEVEVNKLIKKISFDIENFKLNTAISSCMKFINIIKEDNYITKEELRTFLILLNPLAPHVTSELYEIVFGGNIVNESWPQYDEAKIEYNYIEIPVQIKGKTKGVIKVAKDADEKTVVDAVIDSKIINLDNIEIIKTIYVKNRIINFIVK